MTTPTRTRKGQFERGSVAWALMVALALMALGTMFTASVVSTVQRSKASTDAVMLTEHTDTAIASAIAALNAGEPVGQAAADPLVTTKCEKVGGRSMCYRYWAMPVPGTAVNPVRYDLVTHVWIDQGTGVEPVDGRNVRAMKLPLEVVTYQTTGAGMAPVNADGYVAYQPTPSGLFANAIHSFKTTTMEGPAVTVRSYNSQTGDTGTRNATLSSSGWISFGAMTQVDRTVLFGGSSTAAGDHTSRCTGEGCAESGTRVVDATYATPTDASVQWMRDIAPTTCDTVWDGDWITSAHSAKLPSGETCINGSLVVDVPTTMSSPLTTVFINGIVTISDSLNAPLPGVTATPAALVIYSTGAVVSFAAPADMGVAAMVYAPLATCGTDPANNRRITYFGSLVCGTVSIGGEWDHLYDDAAVADFQDPVPGAKKAFSPGAPSAVGVDEFLTPTGWIPNPCPVTPPTAASSYWKLDERSGLLAKESKGSGLAAGWSSPADTARVDAVCGKGAAATTGGTIRGTQPMSSVSGMTVEYWGQSVQGTSVALGALKVTHDATQHVTVTVGTTPVRLPFTIQSPDSWHLFTVTVSTAGQVTLYVDGIMKATAAGGVNPTAAGPLTIGDGTGSLDEVVYYNTPLTATDVANRFTWWTAPPKIATSVVLTSAGIPFSAPINLINNGTTAFSLKLAWTAATGTLSGTGTDAVYQVRYSSTSGGATTVLGTVAKSQNTYALTSSPPLPIGLYYYQVCTIYNGDSQCSAPLSIVTMPLAAAPTITVSAITQTTATFSWDAPLYSDTYESQVRTNGGAWYGTGGVTGGVISHGTGRTITHGPTTAGTVIEVRVRSVNAAGPGAWSAPAIARLTLPAPTVSVLGISTTQATFGWTSATNAAKYQVQVSINNGAWYGAGGTSASVFDLATNTQWTLGPTTQGSNIRIQVRMVDAVGNAGPWSSPGSANLYVDAPTTGGYNLWAGDPQFQVSVNASCPAGTTMMWNAQDQVGSWGGAWNAWIGWRASSDPTATGTFTSYLSGSDNVINQNYYIYCQGYANGSAWVGYSAWGLRHLVTGTPNAFVDYVGTSTSLYVAGWTYDPSIPAASIYVHAYFDIYTPSAIGINTGFARSQRADVGAAYGVGNYHGFGFTIPAPAGYHRLTIFAIGIDGNNVCIYDQYRTFS